MNKTGMILACVICMCTAISVCAEEPSPLTLTVAQAVDEAVKNNPIIRSAHENYEAAHQTVKSERADMLPSISLNYGYTALNEEPIRKTASGSMPVSHQELYGWDVTIVQPLFAGFALHSKLKISQLETIAKKLEKEQAVLDIILGTRSACHNLLLAHKMLMVRDHEVESLQAHKHEAELFFREGLISPNDQLKADVALAGAIQAQEIARANVKKAKMAINQLLGRPLDTAILISDTPDVAYKAFELKHLSDLALKDRPIMQLLNTGIDKLGYSKKLAQSPWYPKVSVVGSYKISSSEPWKEENDFSNADQSFVAIQAQWNFFSSGKTRAQVNAVRRQTKALSAQIDHYRVQVLGEVRNALLDCEVAFKNIQTAEKAVAQAHENVRITNLQYQQQAATTTDVLDANAFLTQADTNYYSAVYGYLNAQAALDRAVGKKQ